MNWERRKEIAERLNKVIASERRFYGETFGGRIMYNIDTITCRYDLQRVDAMVKRVTKARGREILLERMTPKQCERAWAVLVEEGVVSN